MKDLQIGSNGDLVLANGDFQYVEGVDLIRQKTGLILSTNQGEWALNPEEGIDFRVILVKNPNYDQIYDTIIGGIRQVEEDMQIEEYNYNLQGRNLSINFTVSLPTGEEMSFTIGEVPAGGDPDAWLIRALADLVEVNC